MQVLEVFLHRYLVSQKQSLGVNGLKKVETLRGKNWPTISSRHKLTSSQSSASATSPSLHTTLNCDVSSTNKDLGEGLSSAITNVLTALCRRRKVALSLSLPPSLV